MPPDYAPRIWIDGDAYLMAFPDGHTIRVPLSKAPKLLPDILRARLRNELRIAQKGAPVQYAIDRATELAAIEAHPTTIDLHALGLL